MFYDVHESKPFFYYFFIGPSYTNIRTPCRASNEGDLPPGIGAQTRPLTFCLPGNYFSVSDTLAWWHLWLIKSECTRCLQFWSRDQNKPWCPMAT